MKKHILVLPSALETYKYETQGSFIRTQAAALKNSGAKVGMIHVNLRSPKSLLEGYWSLYSFRKEYKSQFGYNEIRLNGWLLSLNMRGHEKEFGKWYIKLYDEYVERHGTPDIVHVHFSLFAGVGAYYIQKKYGVPFFVTEHSTGFARGLFSENHKQLIRKVLNDALFVISSGQKLAEFLEREITRKVEVVGNIVDVEQFTIEVKKKTNFHIFSLAYLLKKKRIDLLIEAFNKVIKSGAIPSDSILEIGGSGPEKNALIKLTQKYDLEENIIFSGEVSRDEVAEKFQSADVFCLPSKYETFGIVYIEAMACGKPVIATKSGGPEDFVNEEVGYLIDIESLEQLAEAITKAYKDLPLWKSKEASIRDYVVKKFSEREIGNKILRLVNSYI